MSNTCAKSFVRMNVNTNARLSSYKYCYIFFHISLQFNKYLLDVFTKRYRLQALGTRIITELNGGFFPPSFNSLRPRVSSPPRRRWGPSHFFSSVASYFELFFSIFPYKDVYIILHQ